MAGNERDDWEPDPDEADPDETQEPEKETQEGEELSDEERQTIQLLRRTGMTGRELVSRAARDLNRERGAAGAGDGKASKGKAKDADGQRVITKEEAQQLLQEGEQRARIAAANERYQIELEQRIDDTVSAIEGLENLPDWRLKAIRLEVATRLSKNLNLPNLGRREYLTLVDKITKTVAAEDSGKKGADTKAGKRGKLDERLENSRKTGGGGNGSVTKAAAGTGDEAEDDDDTPSGDDGEETMDRPRYGAIVARPGEKGAFYTEKDVEEATRKDLEKFKKAAAAGRG